MDEEGPGKKVKDLLEAVREEELDEERAESGGMIEILEATDGKFETPKSSGGKKESKEDGGGKMEVSKIEEMRTKAAISSREEQRTAMKAAKAAARADASGATRTA